LCSKTNKVKNLHLIPTDKPSTEYILGKCIKKIFDIKIGQFVKSHYMFFSKEYFQPHNIYITSSEEIKEGDWYYLLRTNSVHKCIEPIELNLERRLGTAKIIITTDQDLINDGVQAIQDDFIEWFVLEESAKQYAIKEDAGEGNDRKISEINSDFLAGAKSDAAKDYWYAKWQQERMYSEEDMRKAFRGFTSGKSFKEWFEQFKKK